jgi:hypothetical protein
LQLYNCGVASLGAGLNQLTGLTALQSLELHLRAANCAINGSAPAVVALSAALGTTLGHLSQVTFLELESSGSLQNLGGAALAAASSLSCLQELVLREVSTQEDPVALQQLPSSLTSLDMYCGSVNCNMAQLLADASTCMAQAGLRRRF